jgi:hypothetical protein
MGPLYPLPTLRLLHICFLGAWPTFLEILESPSICLVLEDSVNMAALIESSYTQKEKNFSSNEEWQVCCSILHISQDQIARNSQRREAFWDQIVTQYNRNRPIRRRERPERSLKSNWRIIKHNIAKFMDMQK